MYSLWCIATFSDTSTIGPVCASASGSAEFRGLLTSQSLLVSQVSLCRQQAFVASCAKCCCYQPVALLPKWVLHLKAVDS